MRMLGIVCAVDVDSRATGQGVNCQFFVYQEFSMHSQACIRQFRLYEGAGVCGWDVVRGWIRWAVASVVAISGSLMQFCVCCCAIVGLMALASPEPRLCLASCSCCTQARGRVKIATVQGTLHGKDFSGCPSDNISCAAFFTPYPFLKNLNLFVEKT